MDRYLEFVAGRCRPNTLRAVAFDLKTFFARDHGQNDRAEPFTTIIERVEGQP